RHYRIYRRLGAHLDHQQGVAGTRFAVWAPNARRVSVVGDFNHWDGRQHVLQPVGSSGIWSGFVPGVGAGALYKFEVLGANHQLKLKSDPDGFQMQLRPHTASIVADLDDYSWQDEHWLQQRRTWDPLRSPISIYELHPASWKRSWHRDPA